jgi:hypothetical protein
VAIKKVQRVFEKSILAKRALREIKLLCHFNGHENITCIYDMEVADPRTFTEMCVCPCGSRGAWGAPGLRTPTLVLHSAHTHASVCREACTCPNSYLVQELMEADLHQIIRC